jgi:hypothetical protein
MNFVQTSGSFSCVTFKGRIKMKIIILPQKLVFVHVHNTNVTNPLVAGSEDSTQLIPKSTF